MASSTDDLPCILSGTAGHSREGDTTHSALPAPPCATEGRDCAACRLPHCPATHTTESDGAAKTLPVWEEAGRAQGVPSKPRGDEQQTRSMGLHSD